jgi:hypothetical protein
MYVLPKKRQHKQTIVQDIGIVLNDIEHLWEIKMKAFLKTNVPLKNASLNMYIAKTSWIILKYFIDRKF